MEFRKLVQDNILVFDGALGTMLQKNGLKLGENPEVFNIEKRDKLKDIHKAYIRSGANFITTNTFSANKLKLKDTKYSVEEIVREGVLIAKEAVKEENKNVYVALDVGPIGQLLEPMGTLKFEEAYEMFKEQVIVGEKSGADIIIIETMTDFYEAKAALLAVKENTNLPCIVTMSFEQDGRTFTGCSPECMAVVLEGLGADAIGINCSLGPKESFDIIKRVLKWTNLPCVAQPNAGLPKLSFGEAVYDITEEEFSYWIGKFIDEGVNVVGGCCGTTPGFIKCLREIADNKKPVKREYVNNSCVCTPSKMVNIDSVKVVGERINPTGKKLFKKALIENNIEYILKQAIEEVEAGADILDVNVGLPEIDESKMMVKVIKEIQGIMDVPLQIDSPNAEVIEKALRIYNGKACVNSVNGDDEVLDKILPLVKKYGSCVVGLTLDKSGIPKTAEDRFKIAEKIVNKAKEYGIDKKDVFIDCLTLTVSAEQDKTLETLKALKMVHEKLGVKTLLGVSNISFGLPCRSLVNETFLSLALANGLDLPIINPNSEGMMAVINSYKVLANIDKGAKNYIELYGEKTISKGITSNSVKNTVEEEKKDLKYIVIKGLKEEAVEETRKLLLEKSELEIVNELLIPALDIVGKDFESGKIFLPQLIQSAETVKSAFEVIKERLVKSDISKGKIILATVKGDIHDIGKNIVKVILENYGYDVLDLGKDVPIETVVEETLKNDIKLVGLSALMTTTLKSMEETIKALKENGYTGKIFVGGAVLTEDYAMNMGADFYCKDANDSVNVAKKIFN